jgi:glycosyltransferase involved in cell wall biosynthesis
MKNAQMIKTDGDRNVPGLCWPFRRILDSRHRPTAWVAVNGPIITPEHQEEFGRLRWSGHRFVGVSSFMTFPRPEAGADGGTAPGAALDYEAVCEAWCHCFREPDRYLRTQIPRALISVSDFTDYVRVAPELVVPAVSEPVIDFIYVGATEGWKREAKNWRLAGRCIPRLCKELRLRAFVVGAPDADFPANADVVFSGPLAWHPFIACLRDARFLFVPNVLDPSPRVLAEALCLNVPVVVNQSILGGWKYINHFTGTFFDDERDVVQAVRTCLGRARQPRAWFRAHHGPYLAGHRLLQLLKSVEGGIAEPSHVCLAGW